VVWEKQLPLQVQTLVGSPVAFASRILRTSGTVVHMFMTVVFFHPIVQDQQLWTSPGQESTRFLDLEGKFQLAFIV
jgi:hypothetical protein